ncbi:hypothetical protein ACROYT_G015281 [Oculina patagonica]
MLCVFGKSGLDKNLTEKIFDTCHVVICEEDCFSKLVCKKCEAFVSKVSDFKQKSKNIQIVLEEEQKCSVKRCTELSPSSKQPSKCAATEVCRKQYSAKQLMFEENPTQNNQGNRKEPKNKDSSSNPSPINSKELTKRPVQELLIDVDQTVRAVNSMSPSSFAVIIKEQCPNVLSALKILISEQLSSACKKLCRVGRAYIVVAAFSFFEENKTKYFDDVFAKFIDEYLLQNNFNVIGDEEDHVTNYALCFIFLTILILQLKDTAAEADGERNLVNQKLLLSVFKSMGAYSKIAKGKALGTRLAPGKHSLNRAKNITGFLAVFGYCVSPKYEPWLDQTRLICCRSVPKRKLWEVINKTIDGTTEDDMPQELALSWGKEMVAMSGSGPGYCQKVNITPYMHCLIYHVLVMTKRHGSLVRFSGQGVEKINRWDAAINLLLDEKRQEVLRDKQRNKCSYENKDSSFRIEGGKQESARKVLCISKISETESTQLSTLAQTDDEILNEDTKKEESS